MFDALSYMIKPYGLILRQQNGAWELININYLSRKAGTNIKRYEYDYTGTQTGTSSLTPIKNVDLLNRFSLHSGKNTLNDGAKKATLSFNHKTAYSGLRFASDITQPYPGYQITSSMDINTDGTQRLRL